jgi:hypothetical protein
MRDTELIARPQAAQKDAASGACAPHEGQWSIVRGL